MVTSGLKRSRMSKILVMMIIKENDFGTKKYKRVSFIALKCCTFSQEVHTVI